MVQEGNPDCLRRDGVVCLHPGGTNALKVYTQTDRLLLGGDGSHIITPPEFI